MFRPAISALLIVVLLLCPLGCFLRQAMAGAGHSTPAGCCPHCRQESAPAAPAPAPDEEGQGRCCLCEGALHDGPSRSVEVILHADDLAGFVTLPVEFFFASARPSSAAEHLLASPCEPAGRALRAQLSSLLL